MTNTMTKQERTAALSLAGIFAFRMLGLFMILPIFALYAHDLIGATSTLVGMALGIYGLTQAALQIPFGMLSDRIGRKPVILIGLVLFILGSILAALSHGIYGMLFARALQGAGAIGSTIIALAADSTREEHRTKAMALIGIVIGLSFTLAMILGPALSAWIGLSGIFWLTAALGVCGIIILYAAVPTPAHSHFHRDTQPIPSKFKSILKNRQLLRLDIGIFVLHAVLTASFLVIPVILAELAGLPEAKQWYLYLPVLLLSYVFMLPFVIMAEKKRKMKPIFLGSIAIIALSQFSLSLFHSNIFAIGVSLLFFFTAFTILEATLPSLISKIAPIASKGTAIGVYSTAQFLGIFVGGTLGGFYFSHHGVGGVFFLCMLLSGVWLLIAGTMQNPRHLSTQLLTVGPMSDNEAKALSQRLLDVPGVEEATVVPQEFTAYLKVNKDILEENALAPFMNEVDG